MGGSDSDGETLAETDAALMTSGTLSVEDLDTTDEVNISVTSVVESGDVSGIANATLLAMLTAGTNPVIDNLSTTGTIDFDLELRLVVAKRSIIWPSVKRSRLTYTLTVTDSQSATDTQDGFDQRSTGTNDDPVITMGGGRLSGGETLGRD